MFASRKLANFGFASWRAFKALVFFLYLLIFRFSLYPKTLTNCVKMNMSSNPSTSSNGGGGPCGACKFLRRKCVAGCIFAPHFDSDEGAAHFAAVHKVFGASNVSKLLSHLPAQRRHHAVVTICYEAQARLRDPVYGCVSHIFALQQQVVNLQAELSYFQAHLATLEGPTPPPPLPPQSLAPPPRLTINDLPNVSTVIGSYDLSSLLDPMVSPPWTMQPVMRQIDPRQFMPPAHDQGGVGGGDLQELARELLLRPSSATSGPVQCKTEGPSLQPHNR